VDSSAPTQIRTTDVGSFPLARVDCTRYIQGATDLEDGKSSEAATYFIQQHNEAFMRKMIALGARQSVPCYVQSSVKRDMLSQFLDPIVRHGKGLKKQDNTYLLTGTPIRLSKKKAQVAELLALQHGAKTICQELDIDHIQYRACVTGPFEMVSRLWRGMGIGPRYDESLIESFTTIVQSFAQNAQIETKHLKPLVITLDEPSIGVSGIGDLFMDTESDAQLAHLMNAWNSILSQIPTSRYRGLHLHASPYHQLASAHWNLLEAHLGVVVSKTWLVQHDKYIRAAIMRTDEPTIPHAVDLRTAWNQIHAGNFQPYLQSPDEMHHYLKMAVQRYGVDRIPFAGPECGLGSWDWKFGDAMVLANLKNLHHVVTHFNLTQN
jgi:methionine synthase II (cobalamin-independent)